LRVRIAPHADHQRECLSVFASVRHYRVLDELRRRVARRKGKPTQSFLIADTGFKPYGTVVIARRQYVEKNQKETRDLIDAVREGWIEYLRAPDKANNTMVKLNPAMDAVSMKEAAEVQKLFIIDAGAPTQELGKMTMERWRTLVNQLYDLKLIKNKPAAEKLFQNF